MIFDTDVLIWYLKGNPRARDLLASTPSRQRLISIMTHLELLAGNRGTREVREIQGFLRSIFSQVVPLDESISSLALRLVRRHGSSDGLRPADALIAATSMALHQPLVTANVKHYRPIQGLRLEPFAP